MANELLLFGAGAGKSFAARVRRASDLYVLNNTSGAFEAWNDANVALYRNAMTDAGGGAYKATLPTLSGAVILPAAIYVIEYEDLSGALDVPSPEVFDWNGAARVRGSNVRLDLTQALDQTLTTTTVGGALFASWAAIWARRVLDKVARTLKWYKDDAATVAKTVTLDSATVPTQVTP